MSDTDTLDFDTALTAAFAAAAPRVARPSWQEAQHPRGNNVPDKRGRVNRGEFGNKPKAAAAKAKPAVKARAAPARQAASPLSGVASDVYAAAEGRAAAGVADAAAKGHGALRAFLTEAKRAAGEVVARLKAQGRSPLRGDLSPEEQGEYAEAVLRSRLAAEAKPAPTGRRAAERGPEPKQVGRLRRFTSPAVRRRILHAFRNERELAEALSGLNLPDSEAADVVILVGPLGELVTDPEGVRRFLRLREDAVRRAGRGMTDDERAQAGLDAVLGAPLYFLEVKTLITQAGPGRIHMSEQAAARKRSWERRYGAPFFTVAFDDRRGKKFSGSRLYVRRGVGGVTLSGMEPAPDFGEIMSKIGEGR